MATIKDIAKLTQVSTATVSYVLNGKPGAASPAKTREILRIAENLHYQPNSLAKGLKQRKTYSIGIITEDLTVFNAPEIVDGVDEYCEKFGYEIMIENMRLFKHFKNDFTDTPMHKQAFDSVVSNLIAKQVEGIIYVGYHCREISYLPTSVNVPFVYAYCFPKEPIYPSVLFDDEKAGYDVISKLVSLGHRNIGIITGTGSSINSRVRLKGVRKAFENHGISINESVIVSGEWSIESGYRNADILIDQKVTAIFAFNDMMIYGVYKRCMERKLAVGKDISLMGYDNIISDECYSPSISSVNFPLSEMGRKCAEIVLEQIKNRKIGNKSFLLPCTLCERESIGKCIQ